MSTLLVLNCSIIHVVPSNQIRVCYYNMNSGCVHPGVLHCTYLGNVVVYPEGRPGGKGPVDWLYTAY